MSVSSSGPIGKPPAVSQGGVDHLGRCHLLFQRAPGFRVERAATRLTINPGVDWQRTGCFPQLSASSHSASATSGEVASPLTTSTSFITGQD